jgi:hypothetical protein
MRAYLFGRMEREMSGQSLPLYAVTGGCVALQLNPDVCNRKTSPRVLGVRPAYMTYSARDADAVVVVTTVILIIAIIVAG